MKTIEKLSFECAQEESTVLDEQTSALIRHVGMFSFVTTDSLYILDVLQKKICYIKPDDLFLCGFSVDDALRLGCDFYTPIVYPADLSLWTDLRKAILRYIEDFGGKRDVIDCFSCTFRLQRMYSFISRPLPQMVCHRTKPVWEGDELRYLVCSVMSSTSKDSGNLFMQGKDGLTCEEYNFTTRRWKQKARVSLTEREKAILVLAGQGKSTVEIANDLCKGPCTIRNQIKVLFSKLEVHSMQEAIELATFHHMI